MNDPSFSHLDEGGHPRMIDVGGKDVTVRSATAGCSVTLGAEILGHFAGGELHTRKGGVIHTAVVAGIMAAKQTSALIPMCHPLPLDHCAIEIVPSGPDSLAVTCTCRTSARTGVEMEALTGASVAALTVYDMCKALNPAIVISTLKLLEKRGGKSGPSAPA